MGDREHIKKEIFIVSTEPIIPKMVIEENGHQYVYSRYYLDTHYLVSYHYYYYTLAD